MPVPHEPYHTQAVFLAREGNHDFRTRLMMGPPFEIMQSFAELFDLTTGKGKNEELPEEKSDTSEDHEAESLKVIVVGSYAGDHGDAAASAFSGALWLADHAGVFLRALRKAHQQGLLPANPKVDSQFPQVIFNALYDEIGALDEQRLLLLSRLLASMELTKDLDSDNWETIARTRMFSFAEKASYSFSGTGNEVYVLPWAFKIETQKECLSLEERIKSLRGTIPKEVRGCQIHHIELNNWAYFLLLVGRWKAATPMATMATKMSRSGLNLDTLGWAHYFEGNTQLAEELVNEALEKHNVEENATSWAEVAFHKMHVFLSLGKISEASKILDKMQNLAPRTLWTRRAMNLEPLIRPPGDTTTIPLNRKSRHFGYDVAVSFAGEDRKYAEQLAKELRSRGLRVFYDDFEKAELWGKNLYDYLIDVYEKRARYCIILASKNYASKPWPRHERQAAQARAFLGQTDYILPIRLDDCEVPGLLPTTGYLDWYKESIVSIADCLTEKLRRPDFG